ncbi:MAG: amino acid permease, partial [Planctomycetota bacterium]
FAFNGVIAVLTALSMAELASRFPESGGSYTFAKRILSVDTAFNVGWIVWFASIVAAVLYAIGTAHFVLAIAADIYVASNPDATWEPGKLLTTGGAIFTTIVVALVLSVKSGSGNLINFGKVLFFGLLIAGGLAAVFKRPSSEITQTLDPFFAEGWLGLIQAMGYTFIALQGFDLIAAVGGEVKEPARNIPRAMILSLIIALAIYLPLLFIVSTVGVTGDETISAAAKGNEETIVAIAAENFLGSFGYWLVMVAGVLSMFSALQANVFAASRIAATMSKDRTLPVFMGKVSKRGIPVNAVMATAVIIGLTLLVIPDVAAAGAAASLIFLVTFALSHLLAILLRKRSGNKPPPFRSPLFPLVPAVGGLACVSLAIFQGVVVPLAGLIALVWLGMGALLFLFLFARRARVLDAAYAARTPESAQLRGQRPFVLVPIANPDNAGSLVAVANSLSPPGIGKVLLLSVITVPEGWDAEAEPERLSSVQSVLARALTASSKMGLYPETLITVADEPWPEIARVAEDHNCCSMVLGFNVLEGSGVAQQLDDLVSEVTCDIVLLRAPERLHGKRLQKILVPVAGRGAHDELLARLLGSLDRTADRDVTFLRVLPEGASEEKRRNVQNELSITARDNHLPDARIEVVCSSDPVGAVANLAGEHDVTVLGVQRGGKNKKIFSNFSLKLAEQTDGPLIFISRGG